MSYAMQSVAKSPASVPQSKGSKTSVRTRMNSPSGTSDSQVRCQLPHEDCFNVLHSTVNEKLRNFHEPRQTEKASDVLLRMDRQGIIPSFEMYRSLLRACIKRKALADAKQVQAHLCRHGFGSARFLGESTVITFVKCGGLEDALQIFDRLPQRTVFSWTAMISGCTRAGQAQEALRMYERMQEEGVKPNAHTFVSLLQACGIIADLVEGKRIHADVLKHRKSVCRVESM